VLDYGARGIKLAHPSNVAVHSIAGDQKSSLLRVQF